MERSAAEQAKENCQGALVGRESHMKEGGGGHMTVRLLGGSHM